MKTDSKHIWSRKLRTDRNHVVWQDHPSMIVASVNLFRNDYEVIVSRIAECWNQHDQLKEENKTLKDILKRIEDRSATLDEGVKSNSAADKQIASIWEMAHEVNTILSPSNTESNEKE